MQGNKTFPSVIQWQIGELRITVINDSSFVAGETFLTNVRDIDLSRELHDSFRPQVPTLVTNVFLIESPGHSPLLIDAGMGDKFLPHTRGRLLDALKFIGVSPASIGLILLTHLHGDHFYGISDNKGGKVFPNAKIWLSREERAYWLDNQDLTEADKLNANDARNALALYDELEPTGNEILPGISPIALNGHTPGHTGFMLESHGEKLLFCGDILTIPAIQAGRPDIGFITDNSYEQARQVRRSVLQQAADERLLLAGPHFEFPCLSYVQPSGNGYRLIPRQLL